VSYHRGAGDYYRGGRGSIFSVLGGVVKGAVTGFLTKGGPVGALAGAGAGAVSTIPHSIHEETLKAGGSTSAYTPALRAQHAAAVARGTAANPIGSHPAGTPAGKMPHGGFSAATLGEPGTRGFHLIKKGPHAGMVTRNRRMNWANGKAMGRAERRVRAFLHHAQKYIKWAHPHRLGHAVPKLTRHRRK
jgi:hypothetical protein